MGAPIMRIESRRQSNDCAAWALATYLGVPYEDVWTQVLKLDRSKGRNGLHTKTILRIADSLGRPLAKVRPASITEDSYGVITVTHPSNGHAAVVRNGLVFDTDATVWDLPTWLEASGYLLDHLLTEEKAEG